MTTYNSVRHNPSLQLSDVLDDYIVSSTVSTLEDAGFIPPSKRSLKDNVLMGVLIDAGTLDSHTASALVAAQMVHGTDYSTWMPYLSGDAKEIVPVFTHAKDPAKITHALVALHNPSALKIAVAGIVNGMTQSNLAAMENYFGKDDLQAALSGSAVPAAVSLTHAVVSSELAQDKKLMDRFLASLGQIGAHVKPADAQKLDAAADLLRTAQVKPFVKTRDVPPKP